MSRTFYFYLICLFCINVLPILQKSIFCSTAQNIKKFRFVSIVQLKITIHFGKCRNRHCFAKACILPCKSMRFGAQNPCFCIVKCMLSICNLMPIFKHTLSGGFKYCTTVHMGIVRITLYRLWTRKTHWGCRFLPTHSLGIARIHFSTALHRLSFLCQGQLWGRNPCPWHAE